MVVVSYSVCGICRLITWLQLRSTAITLQYGTVFFYLSIYNWLDSVQTKKLIYNGINISFIF